MTVSAARALAVRVLTVADPAEKCALAAGLPAAASGAAPAPPDCPVGPPPRPARPDRPALVAPNQMPRRGSGSVRTRAALLHAVAHIELNAVDLACDLIARFAGSASLAALEPPLGPDAFAADWADVAADEARHFGWLAARLGELGAAYGDLPAHDGLWQASEATAHDLVARLAIVPLVHEARGLDVTPGMAARLRAQGDKRSAAILDRIHTEEIGHVAAGWRWFAALVSARGETPESVFAHCVSTYMPAGLKPPFDEGSRTRAGLLPHVYAGLTRWSADKPGIG